VWLSLPLLPGAAQAPRAAGDWGALHATISAAIAGASLAQSRAHSPEIRNLARLVIRDDGELDRRLRALGAQTGVRIPDVPDEDRASLAELNAADATSFDRRFLNYSYGVGATLRERMRAAAAPPGSPLRALAALFDPIVWQDGLLARWCLGHCVTQVGR
jgi:hypothetical protein